MYNATASATAQLLVTHSQQPEKYLCIHNRKMKRKIISNVTSEEKRDRFVQRPY